MIKVEHLTKCYGDFKAVDDLSFEIGDNKVYGFLGPNGAGKTTTMNIMTGCLSATSGRVLIGDHDIYEDPINAKKLIGYLPEQPPLYLSETPAEYLYFVGEAKGLSGDELAKQVTDAIRRTKIEDVKYKRISALSKGYKQRVGIAQALMGNPEVIILDEPTVGLDPIQIIEIRSLIKSLGETHTVIFSSHILSEVQAMCDEIIIISNGRLVAFDKADQLETNAGGASEIDISAEGEGEVIERILSEIESVKDYRLSRQDDGSISVIINAGNGDPKEVSKAVSREFAKEGVLILELTTRKADLEDVFIELTEAAPERGSDAYASDAGYAALEFGPDADAAETEETAASDPDDGSGAGADEEDAALEFGPDADAAETEEAAASDPDDGSGADADTAKESGVTEE